MSPDPVPSELGAHLGYWLRMVSNHVSHGFARGLGAHDVTVAEWCMMRTLHGRQPISPSRIADEMGMTRGAISRLAERLIGKGLAVRAASRGDARAQTLTLTAQGTELVPSLAAVADRNDESCFRCLTANERDTLERILKSMVERGGIAAVPID
ncbi:MAG TPA: MarR family transcriptional regulator [Allosphingosinicella sp.]|nr:MarR family transcriptional regulator [Allosphingosinicella sp.]